MIHKTFFIMLFAIFITACSPKIVTETKLIKINIPTELLTYNIIKRPTIKTDKDIIKAYTELFYAYKELRNNINQIRVINENFIKQN